jgi:hypothetical protein
MNHLGIVDYSKDAGGASLSLLEGFSLRGLVKPAKQQTAPAKMITSKINLSGFLIFDFFANF